eukprot:5662393-Amphidinium_carterae.1
MDELCPGPRILCRAAWGAIAFGAEGLNPVVRIPGIVQPRPYTAQTVYEAELQAIVEVPEITIGPLVLYTDRHYSNSLFLLMVPIVIDSTFELMVEVGG